MLFVIQSTWCLQANNVANYKCVEGYKLEGLTNADVEASIQCVGDKKVAVDWDGPRPNCERKFVIRIADFKLLKFYLKTNCHCI